MKRVLVVLILFAGFSGVLNMSCTPKTGTAVRDVMSELLAAPANFFDRPEEYIEWQTLQMLNVTKAALSNYPPTLPEPLERTMAMLMLDAVFHDVEAPNRPSVQSFPHQRALAALHQIQNTQVSRGAMIWKLYNMGFIIRTQSLTVAFDVTRGLSSNSEAFSLSDRIIQEIADQCDVLFISHRHDDHADLEVARIFLDQGKPVVAPPDIWKGLPIYNQITHLERKSHEKQLLPIQSGDLSLEVIVYPGHQGADIANNVILIFTPEGISFCHTGDQSLMDDFAWIDGVGNNHKVDVLIPNCWTTDPKRSAEGYNPKLIIPAHENELGHSIDHREAYALNYSRWNVPYPTLFMTWGESFHYKP